jgi:hypothetical protein
MSRRYLITVFILVFISLWRTVFHASGSGIVEIENPQVEYVFGERIEFQARFVSQQQVARVEVFYRPVDGPSTFVGLADIEEDRIVFVHEIAQFSGYIPVFSTVEYRFRVTMQDGQIDLSDVYYFKYADNRYEWLTLEDQPFRVYWVEGDLTFGQAVLDSARSGLKRINTLMDFPNLQKMDIYVYPRSADLQSALQLSGFVLVAGHANPEIGVVMVSLPPGPTQHLEIDRQIPHEIMHVMLFQKYGDRYENIPTWLNEGLASLVEANPDPDYFILLQDAIENNSLLPIETLCSGFRLEASLFYLSYAESESFTRYLYDNFGASEMVELLDRYADGVECTRGPQLVYNQTLARLEDRWYRDLVGETNWSGIMELLLPWLVLLGSVLLVPLVLMMGSLRRHQRGNGSSETKKDV